MLIYFWYPSPFLPTHVLSNTTDLIREAFKFWGAVKLIVWPIFQISNFCLKAQVLSLATMQSLSLKCQACFLHFQEHLRQILTPGPAESAYRVTREQLTIKSSTTSVRHLRCGTGTPCVLPANTRKIRSQGLKFNKISTLPHFLF